MLTLPVNQPTHSQHPSQFWPLSPSLGSHYWPISPFKFLFFYQTLLRANSNVLTPSRLNKVSPKVTFYVAEKLPYVQGYKLMRNDPPLPSFLSQTSFLLCLPSISNCPPWKPNPRTGWVSSVAACRKATWSHPRDVAPTQTHPAPRPLLVLLPQ